MSCENLQEQIKWKIGDFDNSLENCLALAILEHLTRECRSLPTSYRATIVRAFATRGESADKLTEIDQELHQKAIDQAISYLQKHQLEEI